MYWGAVHKVCGVGDFDGGYTLGEGKWDDAKRVLSFNTCMDIFTHPFRLQTYKAAFTGLLLRV